MAFYDDSNRRRSFPGANTTSSTPPPSRTAPANFPTPTSGNRGEGDPVNGYPYGSTTPGYIDYRDIAANGPFYPGTKRQRYRDDPNARKRHTPGSNRAAQMDAWEAAGYPTGKTPGYDGSYPYYPGEGDDRGSNSPLNRGSVASTQSAPGGANPYDVQGRQAAARQRFIDQGGTGATWDNRFNTSWPVPRSPLGAYSHGPGRPDWETRFTNPLPPGVSDPNRGVPPASTQSAPTPVPSSLVGGTSTGGNPSSPFSQRTNNGPNASTGQNETGGTSPTTGGTNDTAGNGGDGWRKNFKQTFVRYGGSPQSWDGSMARGWDAENNNWRTAVDPNLAPADYKAQTYARDTMQKQAQGMPSKFFDPSRYDPSTRTYR